MPTEKSESKPDTTEDPATDEEHPQDALRREGLRLNPQFQTEHLDTTGGGPVDLHRISPVFEEARQHAVRSAALAADEDYAPDNVVFSDDVDEADRQREHVRKLAQDIPDEDPDRRPPGTYADGMGGPYGQGVIVGSDGEPVNTNEQGETEDPGASETSKPVAAPATKATAGDDGDEDEKDTSKSTSSSSAARKTTAKPASSSSASTAKKTESK
jgi:hypothetical protein